MNVVDRTSDEALADDAREHSFNYRPLLFTVFACSLANVSFVALIGPLARFLDLEPWQAGAVVAASGVAWTVSARS